LRRRRDGIVTGGAEKSREPVTAAEVAVSEAIPLGTAKSRIRAAMLRLHDVLGAKRVDND